MQESELNGNFVLAPCVSCNRNPGEGARYGILAHEWDFANVCPACCDGLVVVA